MPRRHSKALLIWSCGFLGMCAAGAQAPDPLVADPQHIHLELENQWVRVFQEHMGPHESMPMHQHPAPGAVIIFLTARNNRLTYFDGTVKLSRSRRLIPSRFPPKARTRLPWIRRTIVWW